MIWTSLVKAALLGADRSTLPAPVRRELHALGLDPDLDNAQLLIDGAALYLPLQKAAQGLPLHDGPPAPAETSESSNPCSPRAARLFERIVRGHHRPALEEFLHHLQRSGHSLPPEQLPTLFDAALQDPELWRRLEPAIGDRGRWLLRINPNWRPLDDEYDLSEWETGSRQARIALLEKVRRRDPAQGVALLEKTWADEPNELRLAFLDILARHLSASDEPFLETCLDDKRQEVRRRAADLLSLIPDSGLLQRHWGRVITHLQASPAGDLLVELPKSLDGELRRDGLLKKDPAFAGGERAGWLGQLVARIPPRLWETHFDKTPPALLAWWRQSQWAPVLLPALFRAIDRHRDERWAAAAVRLLLEEEELWASSFAKQLLAGLPVAVFNRTCIGYLEHHSGLLPPAHLITHLLSLEGRPWEDRLAVLVITGFQKKLDSLNPGFSQPVHYLPILENAAYLVNPDLFDTFKTGWNFYAPAWRRWEPAVEQFLETLAFRRDMIRALNNHQT